MRSVHTDYVNVSFPADSVGGFLRDHEVKGDLERFVSQAGVLQVGNGLYKYDTSAKVSGSIRTYRKGGALVISTSGAMLNRFREFGLFEQYLAFIGSYPHRVTLVDLAMDVCGDSPKLIQALAARARAGNIQLTRKRLSNENCKFISQANDSGDITGTVNLGKRGKHEVYAKIYDKQWERICHNRENGTNFEVGLPRTRFEITVSGKYDITLRDVAEPTALFWHFMGRSVLDSPADVPDWVGLAEGYSMGERVSLSSLEALERRIEYSAEVESLWRMASNLGAAGEANLIRLLRRRYHALDAVHGVELSKIALDAPSGRLAQDGSPTGA